jgi:glycosyltransferase involved in cell wall biosynthesis
MKIPLHIRLHTKRSLYPGNVLRQVLSRASGLTAESRDVGHYYEDYLSKSRSIKVIRQSIDIEKLKEVDVPIKLEAEVKLIAIGRLVSKKGFDVLIEALSICRDSVFEKVSLDIYGSGQLQLTLEKLVQNKGIEHIVSFRGVLEHQDLMKKLAMADLLIVPSIELSDDVDGVPTVIAESMVLGTAVLSTPIAGISELVVDNVTGFLAAPNSADDLKTKLECLVNDRTKRESVIVAASDKVASEYKITLASELY